MSKKISLVPYTLRLLNKKEDRNFVTNRLPENSSLKAQVHDYLTARQNSKSVLNDLQSAIKTETLFAPEVLGKSTSEGALDGIIQCGEYGYAADLENLQTGHQFKRGINDCEYLPFYYHFLFKDGQDEVIVLLQRFGIHGIKTVLEDDLGRFIEERVPESKLSMSPIVSEDYIRKLLGGGIKRLRYTKFSVPSDIADDIGADDHMEETASMELVIKAKRNEFLKIPNWMRTDKIDRSKTIEINGVEYDEIKVEVDVDGKKKTVDLSDIQKFSMSIDVTDDIGFNKNGHPVFASIRDAANGLMPMIQKAIRWESVNDKQN